MTGEFNEIYLYEELMECDMHKSTSGLLVVSWQNFWGKPLFRGKDYVDQLNQILMILGTPPESTLQRIGSHRAQNYVRSLPITRKASYEELF